MEVQPVQASTCILRKCRVRRDGILELALQVGVFCQHARPDFLHHIRFRIFLLLKDSVEEAPCNKRIGSLRFKQVHGDLRRTLIRPHHQSPFRIRSCLFDQLGRVRGSLPSFIWTRTKCHAGKLVRLNVKCKRLAQILVGDVMHMENLRYEFPFLRHKVGVRNKHRVRDQHIFKERNSHFPWLARVDSFLRSRNVA